mmetsp:Transcript_54126/g.150566  ORF Transcript_54126/g.150566 Transcript_54126/m.150566 type:complete len:281 (+) Transcript_54126:533-1375(+)
MRANTPFTQFAMSAEAPGRPQALPPLLRLAHRSAAPPDPCWCHCRASDPQLLLPLQYRGSSLPPVVGRGARPSPCTPPWLLPQPSWSPSNAVDQVRGCPHVASPESEAYLPTGSRGSSRRCLTPLCARGCSPACAGGGCEQWSWSHGCAIALATMEPLLRTATWPMGGCPPAPAISAEATTPTWPSPALNCPSGINVVSGTACVWPKPTPPCRPRERLRSSRFTARTTASIVADVRLCCSAKLLMAFPCLAMLSETPASAKSSSAALWRAPCTPSRSSRH